MVVTRSGNSRLAEEAMMIKAAFVIFVLYHLHNGTWKSNVRRALCEQKTKDDFLENEQMY